MMNDELRSTSSFIHHSSLIIPHFFLILSILSIHVNSFYRQPRRV